MEVTFYKNCDELPLYNFHKCLETNNYAYLVREYDDAKEAPEFDIEAADKVWVEIFEEYCKLIENNEVLMLFALQGQLLYLETRYKVSGMFLKHIYDCKDVPEIVDLCIDELAKWKYVINKANDLDSELRKIAKSYKASMNKIKLKQDEIDMLKPDPDEPKVSLTEQIVQMEQALNRNEIDPKKTTVGKWVAMHKELERINRLKRKSMRRN
jgi:hypothetical protein